MARTSKPKSTAARRSDAAKKAMAERGKFKPEANSDYGKPYSAAVSKAVTPFNEMLQRAQRTWGQRLLECVPPSHAARYASLIADLDEAMIADDAKIVANIAGTLCKGLPIMHKAAIDAGHKPAASDVVTMVVDGVVYAFVLRGDLGLVRKQNPDWVVYHMADAVYALRGHTEALVQEAAKHFANVKISNVSREIVDDDIVF